MAVRSFGWPAPAATLQAARTLLLDLGRKGGRVIVAPDKDADGLGSGALMIRALERMGAMPIIALPNKGEHVHTPAMRARLSKIPADGLVVLDMGSRSGPIVDGLPTIVIDHHDARETPEAAIYVSSAGAEPVAPTGLLTFLLLQSIANIDDLAWLALIATVGDLGANHPFADELGPLTASVRKTHVAKAVSLINAARRSASYQPELALRVLLGAESPAAIVRPTSPELARGVAELEACRAQVQAEVERVARVAPRIANNVALIRFTSGAQIHPLIATRWATRLAPKIVLVANDGYLPGRVNFAMRSASKTDLLVYLRGLGLGVVEGEFANGHPRATGGSVPPAEFERILGAMGFTAQTT